MSLLDSALPAAHAGAAHFAKGDFLGGQAIFDESIQSINLSSKRKGDREPRRKEKPRRWRITAAGLIKAALVVGDLGWTLETGSNPNANDFAEKSLCKSLKEATAWSVTPVAKEQEN
jgi:hypothetical protein